MIELNTQSRVDFEFVHSTPESGPRFRERIAIICALIVGFVFLSRSAAGNGQLAGDVPFTLWVQGWDWSGFVNATDATNALMTGLPLTIGTILILALVLRVGWWTEAAVLIALVAFRMLNAGLKLLMGSPRPSGVLVERTSDSDSFGFPSGHTAGSLLLVCGIAWSISRHLSSRWQRWAVWAAAGVIVAVTGLGRIRVGAHWPSDVLGALLWSTAALLAIVGLVHWWQQQRLQPQ